MQRTERRMPRSREPVPYRLYYWEGLPGRGEFVRLALEDADAPYVDIARGAESAGQGTPALLRVLDASGEFFPPFAPPFLRDGSVLVSHVANILMYLGPRLGLAPAEEGLRHFANGLQLTIADCVTEVHDTHHPISTQEYYEKQKPAAKKRAAAFISTRLPKYLGYFERVLAGNLAPGGHAVGDAVSYVDLSLFQLIAGLLYAFPCAMQSFPDDYPRLADVHARVPMRPRLAHYLGSSRRLTFNESGIFRHYAELDRAPDPK